MKKALLALATAVLMSIMFISCEKEEDLAINEEISETEDASISRQTTGDMYDGVLVALESVGNFDASGKYICQRQNTGIANAFFPDMSSDLNERCYFVMYNDGINEGYRLRTYHYSKFLSLVNSIWLIPDKKDDGTQNWKVVDPLEADIDPDNPDAKLLSSVAKEPTNLKASSIKDKLNNIKLSYYFSRFLNYTNTDGFKLKPGTGSSAKGSLWNIVPVGEYDLVSLEYSLLEGEVPIPEASFMSSQYIDNSHNLSSTVTSVVTFNSAYAETSTFRRTHGFNVTLSTGVSIGVPIFVDGNINVSMTSTNTWEYGKSETRTITDSYSLTVPVPPGKIYKASISIARFKIAASYKAIVRSKLNGVQTTIRGRWEGIQASAVTTKIVDIATNQIVGENVEQIDH